MVTKPPDQTNHGRLGREGFTIVEVVVAVLLLTVSVMSLSSFALYTARQVQNSKRVSLATIVARQEIDEARAEAFDDLEIGITIDTVTLGTLRLYATRRVILRATNLKFVTVVVAELTGRELQRFQTHIHKGDAQ